jgi:hypothetical protein
VEGEPTGTTGVVVVVPLGTVVVVLLGTVVVVLLGTVVVVVGDTAAHVETLIVLSSNVTAPLRASIRPLTVAPVFRVIEVRAMRVPTKLVVVPRVADEPTCQKTLHACAPFSSTTLLPEAVVSVEPAWRMKTAPALPPPLSVNAPVSPRLDDEV